MVIILELLPAIDSRVQASLLPTIVREFISAFISFIIFLMPVTPIGLLVVAASCFLCVYFGNSILPLLVATWPAVLFVLLNLGVATYNRIMHRQQRSPSSLAIDILNYSFLLFVITTACLLYSPNQPLIAKLIFFLDEGVIVFMSYFSAIWCFSRTGHW